MVSPPQVPAKPGILVVTLHEGKEFSLPPHYQQQYNSQFQSSMSSGYGVAGSVRNDASMARTPGGVAGSYAQNGRQQSTGVGINAAPTIHGRYSSRHLPYALLDFDKLQVFVDAVSGSPQNPYWAGDNTSYKFDVSRATELSVQIYLRNPSARPGAGRSEDIFLGAVRVNPRFEEARQYVEDPKASKKDKEKDMVAFAQKERSMGQLGTEWIDVAFGTGSIKVGVAFVENRQRTLKIEDFELLKVVGKGSFGKVMQVMYEFLSNPSLTPENGAYCSLGSTIHTGFTPSKPSARHISSPDPKLLIRLQSDQFWPRSTIPSSFLSNSPSNPQRNCT